MAKAVPLTMSTLSTPQITPKAATPARTIPAVTEEAGRAPAAPKIKKTPLQIHIPEHDARAIRVAAATRGESISDFMLSCFHAVMKDARS